MSKKLSFRQYKKRKEETQYKIEKTKQTTLADRELFLTADSYWDKRAGGRGGVTLPSPPQQLPLLAATIMHLVSQMESFFSLNDYPAWHRPLKVLGGR